MKPVAVDIETGISTSVILDPRKSPLLMISSGVAVDGILVGVLHYYLFLHCYFQVVLLVLVN